VIDLGTGSGAIAVAIGKSMPDARIVAIDVDPAALRVAAQNMGRHRLSSRVQLVRRDLLTGSRAADLIVANLPYLSSGSRRSWPKELGFEPLRALDGGSSGLEFIQRALAQAPAVLRKDGCMLLECDPKQVQRINKMVLRAWPASTVTIHKDLAGRDRVVQIQV
jgi:release factor glutamine methyltransferase